MGVITDHPNHKSANNNTGMDITEVDGSVSCNEEEAISLKRIKMEEELPIEVVLAQLRTENMLFKKALTCSICLDYFVKPHTLSCGHTFCGLCIQTAMKDSVEESKQRQCFICRAIVDSYPTPSYALEAQLDIIFGGFTPQELHLVRQRQKDANIALNELNWGHIFPLVTLVKKNYIYDSSDSVYRCGNCNCEIAKGECSVCGLSFPELLEVTNENEDLLSEDDALDDENDEDESDDMDDMDDFIEDDGDTIAPNHCFDSNASEESGGDDIKCDERGELEEEYDEMNSEEDDSAQVCGCTSECDDNCACLDEDCPCYK